MKRPTKNPLVSLESVIVFSSHDYSETRGDAWIYGIVIGWDKDSLKELQEKFSWSDKDIIRLENYHKQFNKIKRRGLVK